MSWPHEFGVKSIGTCSKMVLGWTSFLFYVRCGLGVRVGVTCFSCYLQALLAGFNL